MKYYMKRRGSGSDEIFIPIVIILFLFTLFCTAYTVINWCVGDELTKGGKVVEKAEQIKPTYTNYYIYVLEDYDVKTIYTNSEKFKTLQIGDTVNSKLEVVK